MRAGEGPLLSVCCHWRGDGARVAAMLERLRAVADEIVVVADVRTSLEDLGYYAAGSDRVVPYEYRGAARDAAWMHAQCSGRWILWLAGDEVPSSALIRQLPQLISDNRVLQYWFPTCWLFPDAHHYLAEDPWWPDFHNRLVRNDGTLRFPGLPHTGADPVYPAAYIDAPLYHLNLILTSEAERGEKARRYERARPSINTEDGRPLNDVLYSPERWARRRPLPVPQPDRTVLEEILHAPAPSSTRFTPSVRPVTRPEIERAWARRPLGSNAYQAKLTPITPAVEAPPGGQRRVYVRVQNEGVEMWPWGLTQHPQIRLGYVLRNADGVLLPEHGPRSPLPRDLGPGESTIAAVDLVVPETPGLYRVEVDLVHENVRWFGCTSSIELRATRRDASDLLARAQRSGPAQSGMRAELGGAITVAPALRAWGMIRRAARKSARSPARISTGGRTHP